MDVLAEHGEALLPIEIKSGQTVTRDYLIGLQKWLALAGAFASKPLLIYVGDSRHTRSGIEIRPRGTCPRGRSEKGEAIRLDCAPVCYRPCLLFKGKEDHRAADRPN